MYMSLGLMTSWCLVLGGGHLHSEVGGPELHLTILPAGEKE